MQVKYAWEGAMICEDELEKMSYLTTKIEDLQGQFEKIFSELNKIVSDAENESEKGSELYDRVRDRALAFCNDRLRDTLYQIEYLRG